jgi:ADP-ribose pyrophosphatase YjhB (NUDIX family)
MPEQREDVLLEAQRRFLSPEIYKQAQKLLITACIDVFIIKPAGLMLPGMKEALGDIKYKRGVILGNRAQPPVKDTDWPIGGREIYGHHPDIAAFTKVLQETGLKVKYDHFIGIGSTLFIKGESRHTLNTVVAAEIVGGELLPSKDYNYYKFITETDSLDKFHPYVSTLLKRSGIFGGKPSPCLIILDEKQDLFKEI